MSYVPPTVPERWDIGVWDEAHWDGQLGLQPDVGSVVVNGLPVAFGLSRGHPLTADTTGILVTSIAAKFRIGPTMAAATGAIHVDATDAVLQWTRHIKLVADVTVIHVDMNKQFFSRSGSTMPDPGVIHFGKRVTLTPRRW